jgi:hypothetical protein
MKILKFIFIGLVIISCNPNETKNELTNDNKNKTCHELPDFIIIKKSQLNDSTFIINCHLDDNSIHQFMDGAAKVNIVPIMTNETNQKKLSINKESLVGIDTVRLNQADNESMIYYSITFPSPKGGDVTITKGIKIK